MNAVSNKAISEYLSNNGIFHSSNGYKFLMLSIRAILDGAVDRKCAKAIYDYVAEQSGAQPGQVDRAIRHALRKAAVQLSNKEFLIRAADELAFTADANAFLFEPAIPEPSG